MRIALAEREDREGSSCRWDRSRVTPGMATAPEPTLAKDKVSWFPAGDAPSLLQEPGTSGHSWSDVRACGRAVPVLGLLTWRGLGAGLAPPAGTPAAPGCP